MSSADFETPDPDKTEMVAMPVNMMAAIGRVAGWCFFIGVLAGVGISTIIRGLL